MTIDPLFRQADQQTHSLLRQAEKHFGIECPLSGIRFDLRGKTAGMVVFPGMRKPYIRYNPDLLLGNRESFLDSDHCLMKWRTW